MTEDPSLGEVLLGLLLVLGVPTLLVGAVITAVTGCVVGLKAWRATKRPPVERS
ncbi:hypothetical protein [Streptomyces genisteinicus]|uniref:Uncharacterized protein n=1 Tax=Streptomyces genisteinicus TaxID=2768068 RepID=A0A7H0HVV6_9ACTN|nr:hypothetical protein [Streptomyces genisteinicus]QNP64672.1 hypothetical protein IAG43_18290 [Streptomyces genisteinicus]